MCFTLYEKFPLINSNIQKQQKINKQAKKKREEIAITQKLMTRQCAFHVHVPTCLACLLAHVPMCLWFLRAHCK